MAQDLSAFKTPQSMGVLKSVEKNKGGRPPKKAKERRTKKITVYFTPAEKEKMSALADKMGVDDSTLIRIALADKGYL